MLTEPITMKRRRYLKTLAIACWAMLPTSGLADDLPGKKRGRGSFRVKEPRPLFIVRAGREIPNVTTIYPGKLPTGADGVHFSAEGYVALGKITASAVEQFYKDR